MEGCVTISRMSNSLSSYDDGWVVQVGYDIKKNTLTGIYKCGYHYIPYNDGKTIFLMDMDIPHSVDFVRKAAQRRIDIIKYIYRRDGKHKMKGLYSVRDKLRKLDNCNGDKCVQINYDILNDQVIGTVKEKGTYKEFGQTGIIYIGDLRFKYWTIEEIEEYVLWTMSEIRAEEETIMKNEERRRTRGHETFF